MTNHESILYILVSFLAESFANRIEIGIWNWTLSFWIYVEIKRFLKTFFLLQWSKDSLHILIFIKRLKFSEHEKQGFEIMTEKPLKHLTAAIKQWNPM